MNHGAFLWGGLHFVTAEFHDHLGVPQNGSESLVEVNALEGSAYPREEMRWLDASTLLLLDAPAGSSIAARSNERTMSVEREVMLDQELGSDPVVRNLFREINGTSEGDFLDVVQSEIFPNASNETLPVLRNLHFVYTWDVKVGLSRLFLNGVLFAELPMTRPLFDQEVVELASAARTARDGSASSPNEKARARFLDHGLFLGDYFENADLRTSALRDSSAIGGSYNDPFGSSKNPFAVRTSAAFSHM